MNKEILLFCFPFAGGTTAFFDQIETSINNKSDRIKLVKLEYSGHGKRMKEPFYDSFDKLSEDLMPRIEKVLDQYPGAAYGMLGYSMGSLSAFTLIQKIARERKMRQPNHLFLAAHPPKPIERLKEVPNDEIEEWCKQRTIAFGGVPEKLINNNAFWRMYLPMYMADYRIIASYAFDMVSFTSDIPTTVFYSEIDTPFTEVSEWNKYFTHIEFIEFDGSHFFIDKHFDEMADVICRNLDDKI